MTKQTDYTVEKEVYDSFNKTTYYYVHTPHFDTTQQAEKLRLEIIKNQKIVHVLEGAALSFLNRVLSINDMKILKILFDDESMKLLTYFAEDYGKSVIKDKYQ